MVHRSRVDAWLRLALLASAGVSFGVAAALWRQSPTPVIGIAVSLLAAVGGGLPLWVLFGTRYEVTAGQLLVHSGPFRWRVPVAEITRVEPSTSALSAPALSLQRLRIDHGRGRWLLVSPEDPQAFRAALRAAGAVGA